MNNKGFTLVELLVVVLIVGILAAVALPQYNKAVEKAKVLPYLSLLAAVSRSADIYKMATGESIPESFDDLDIKIPVSDGNSLCGINPVTGSNLKETKVIKDYLTMNLSKAGSGWKSVVFLCRYSPAYGSYMFSTDGWYNTNKIVCYELSSSAKTPCKTLFGAEQFSHANAQAERFYYMP